MEEIIVLLITAGLGGTFLGALSYFLGKPSQRKDRSDKMNYELKEYIRVAEEIYAERAQIIEVTDNLRATPNFSSELSETRRKLSTRQGSRFFPTSIEPSTNYQATTESTESKELISHFAEQVNSYPKFCSDRARNDPDYINNIHQELVEHHSVVMVLKEECFRRAGIVDYRTSVISSMQVQNDY